tara:strand:- start:8244 stop:8783 length:540 start_codon:yes stop_codon:yes gene_type:complete
MGGDAAKETNLAISVCCGADELFSSMNLWQFLLLASIALLSLPAKTTDTKSLSIEVNRPANIAKTKTPIAVDGISFALQATETIDFDSGSTTQRSVSQIDLGSKLDLGIPSLVPMFALTTSLPLTTVWLSKPSASYDERLLDVDGLSELRLLPHWTVAQTLRLRDSKASLLTLCIRLQV